MTTKDRFLGGGMVGTNTYLIGLGDRKILLDVGEGDPAYLQLLQQCLKDISPTAYISDILISHCHHDHWVNDLPSIDHPTGTH
jgi:ribonuclease BN (tRNA processing enzyme)